VLVAFNVDGGGTRLERIQLIPASSEKTATFGWTPSAGRHVLRFEVDPEHALMERDEGNNLFLERVTIAGSLSPQEGIPPAVLVAGSATVFLGVLGLAVGGTEYGKYWFLGLLFVPLYTKIKKDDVLDHFVRGQVYGYIKANPGEHYNSIKKALSLKNGTLVYHLKTLEREEFIKSVSDGRFKRFYPKEMKVPEPAEEMVLRMNHIQHEILNIIRETPGISQKEIAARIGLSTPTVHYHINIMMSARAIMVRRSGRETRCYIEDAQDGRAG
jgi:DNA-binding MarR family transcriptional regulator